MKRVLVLLSLFLLTGCGESTVVCNKEQKEEYVTMNQTIKMNFKWEKLLDAEYKINSVLKEEYKDLNDYFVGVLEEQFATFEDEYGVKINIEKNESGAILKMNLTKDNFEKMYLDSDTEKQKEDIIESFKEKGYTCK